MKLGIISDIHCNLHGLQRALAALDGVDEVLCLGDSINGQRFSNDVVAALKARGALVILGNHEEEFFSSRGAEAREDNGTDAELASWLAGQPHRRELFLAGRKLLMIHSTPWEPRGDYVFPQSEHLERFAEADADIVLYGHTHTPVVRRVGRVLVVNPGAVGEAHYRDGGWLLSCAILDVATEAVEVLSFPDPRFSDGA